MSNTDYLLCVSAQAYVMTFCDNKYTALQEPRALIAVMLVGSIWSFTFVGNEAGCRADFETAANLGSRFAKQQLVAINPYAAMCNSMLTEMVTKLRRGEPENNGDAAA